MKLFTTPQIKTLDAYTIAHEPISSLDLMERASVAISDWLLKYFDTPQPITVVAGSGNNGGDGLAVARLLATCGFEVEVVLVNPNGKLSADCEINKQRLIEQGRVRLVETQYLASLNNPHYETKQWKETQCIASLQNTKSEFIIDALFGSGLNRPLDGEYAAVVKTINESNAKVISIDIPSGLFGEDNSTNNPDAIVKADITLTLQFPKIAFFFPKNEDYVGEFHVIDIGIHPEAISSTNSPYFLTDTESAPPLKVRGKFSHKGTYGHALFIGGSYGKMGAAVLASRACLRTGVGLLTVHTPECGVNILQTAVPEAMCLPDKEHSYVSLLTEDVSPYSAIGIGCGLGTEPETSKVLKRVFEEATQPLVLDADALNILSTHPEWMDLIPKNTIITPHPKEFERLTGPYNNRFEQIEIARIFSKKHTIFVVLKGAYTAVVCPDGEVHFNSSGNPGMAKGGSGDILCGMILSLLAQAYSPKESAILGVFLHGKAGDDAAANFGQTEMIAGDIIEEI